MSSSCGLIQGTGCVHSCPMILVHANRFIQADAQKLRLRVPFVLRAQARLRDCKSSLISRVSTCHAQYMQEKESA